MSTRTTYYVRIIRGVETTVSVCADSLANAADEAKEQYPDTITVLEVRHWSEVEGDDGY